MANGTIAGRVTDRSTSAPLASVQVLFYEVGSQIERSALTAPDGTYSISLPSSAYNVEVVGLPGYVAQIYDGISCMGLCFPQEGTALLVSDGSVIGGIDFALSAAGQIGGTVTDTNGLPLANVTVNVRSQGYYVGSAQTDVNGSYRIDNLEPGLQYTARTYSYPRYVDELYNDIVCYYWCDSAGGTPIPVDAGALSEVNFELSSGGTISGSITASDGTLLSNIQVYIFNSSGKSVISTVTDQWGIFTTIGLPAGTYYAQTRNSFGYVDVTFPNLPCINHCDSLCDPTSGTPIAVVSGSDTAGIDFSLQRGGGISGKVIDSNGDPISSTQLTLYDGYGLTVSGQTTDGSGTYLFEGLLPGAYYLALNHSDYIAQLYDQKYCSRLPCHPTTGTAINVAADQITADVNVTLVKGGVIQGTITDQLRDALDGNITLYDVQKKRWSPDTRMGRAPFHLNR